MGKKPRSDSQPKKNRKQRSKKSGPNSVAMKLKAPEPNPFETIWSRRKFDILGKKSKGEERRVGLARSLAIQKRKKTLLKEYEQSGKSSVFLDKRIGEQNEVLGEFDKAILRSQRERQLKLNKKSKYNLSDGEEDELEIEGGLFPERDDFEDELPFDEDDDDRETDSGKKSPVFGSLNNSAVENSQQAALTGNEARQKSKKEVMEEIISKSKFFKAEKAKDKEENEQLIEQLDQEFTSLVHSESLLSLTQPNKMHALQALVNRPTSNNEAKKNETTSVQAKAPAQLEKPDSYDKLVSEMALDMRAHPSDRTKTAEEIAQEQKERLEQLEEERQKRMFATDDGSSDEEANGSVDNDASLKRLRSLSGDDLGDSFSNVEESRTKLGWIGNVLGRNEGDDESEDGASTEESEGDEDDVEDDGTDEDDGNDKAQSLKDWEQSDDDEVGTDLEDDKNDEDDNDSLESEKTEPGKKGNQIKIGDVDIKGTSKQHTLQYGELPYTIEAPKCLEELTSLIENRPDDQIVEAIRRIRAYNAINVAAGNKRKMQIFYGVLLQYFAVLANKKPLKFKLLNLLVKPLMEMSAEIPYFAAICARQRLLRTRSQFSEDLKMTGKSCWPSLKTIFLLRLWSMIFPCSDFRHVVMTPAILLICEYLMRCPIISGRDIVIGSFLCSLMLSITKQSRKFCPEALTFMRALLTSAFDGAPEDHQLSHLLEIKVLKPLLRIKTPVKEINSLNFLTLMDLPEDSPYFSLDQFRASVLAAATETLTGFVDVYEGFNSFPEIFLPISKLVSKLADEHQMPEMLQNNLRDLSRLIVKKADEHHALRLPLQMRKKKPVPIKMLNPKFEENFVKGRDYDPDRERGERKKLKRLLKRETKGAARELRKDNHFLFEVKQNDKRLLEEEKAEKYGKARVFLQEQEHAFKSGQLGKGRKRRR